MALSDLAVTAEFLCLRVAVLLTRAAAAPEDTTGSEVLLFVAIQDNSPLTQLDSSILANFTARAPKSFYQFHYQFRGRDVSDSDVSGGSPSTEVY
jgi:hypothetical protein